MTRKHRRHGIVVTLRIRACKASTVTDRELCTDAADLIEELAEALGALAGVAKGFVGSAYIDDAELALSKARGGS